MSDHAQNQPSTASTPPPPEDPGNKAASSIKAVGEAIGAIPSGIKSVIEAVSAAILLLTTIRSNLSNVLIVSLCTVWLLCLLARWRPNIIPKVHRRWVKGVALFGVFAIPLSTLGIYGYRLLSPPRDTIVAVAEFDGPDPQNYDVTPRLINSLSLALKPYKDIRVVALREKISEGDSSAIRKVQREVKPTVLIWGSYAATETNASVGVHFEVLRSAREIPEFGPAVQGERRVVPIAQLNSFSLQTKLSEEMTSLTLFTMGLLRYNRNDWTGAVSTFSDALQHTHNEVSSLSRGIILYYRGTSHLFGNQPDQAITDFRRAIRHKADGSAVYQNLGAAYSVKRRFPEAIKSLTQALKLDPNSFISYYGRAVAYRWMGKTDLAIADFDSAIRLRPNDAESYLNRGEAHAHKGESDRAIEDYSMAIKLNNKATIAYYLRGRQYHAEGNYKLALQDLDRAIQLEPKFVDAYQSRALTYTILKQYNQAINDYTQTIKIAPQLAAAYAGRGAVYVRLQDYGKALDDLTMAIKLDPRNAEYYLYRGIARAAEHQRDLAMVDFRDALLLSKDPYIKKQAEARLWALIVGDGG